MNLYKVFFIVITAWATGVLPAGSIASELSVSHHLSWQPVQVFPANEAAHMEVLYFDGAVFSDTVPEIPVFSHRVRAEVPFFVHHFELQNKTYTAVSQYEDEILRKAGFRQDSIRLQPGQLSTRKQRFSTLQFYPFRYDAADDSYEKLLSFTLTYSQQYDSEIKGGYSGSYTDESVLNNGSWYRVCVDET